MKKNLFLLLLFILFAFLFFYRLDFKSLASFDEAWYGVIAREVTRSNNPLILKYNQEIFTDHPPMAIYLMALSYKFLGINEFSTRLPAALAGLLSLVLIYLIAKILISKKAALVASILLASCLWFVLRVRSGNLDSPFLFFYLLTVYFSLSLRKNINNIFALSISFAALFLTKTLMGISVLPLIVFNLVSNFDKFRTKRQINKLLLAIFIVIVLVLPWYLANSMEDNNFLKHHFFTIGLRSGEKFAVSIAVLKQTLLYLQIGMGKWFKLFMASLLSFILFIKLFYKKWQSYFLLLWILVLALPFLSSAKTEIWHLIPLYPPIILMTLFVFECIISRFFLKKKKLFLNFLYGLLIMIAAWQLHQSWNLLIPNEKKLSDEADISLQARNFSGTIQLKEVFLPEAIFYADKYVYPLGLEAKAYDKLKNYLKNEKDYLYIVRNQELASLDKDNLQYKLLAQNNSYSLICSKKAKPLLE